MCVSGGEDVYVLGGEDVCVFREEGQKNRFLFCAWTNYKDREFSKFAICVQTRVTTCYLSLL